jgi:hypothetical protein
VTRFHFSTGGLGLPQLDCEPRLDLTLHRMLLSTFQAVGTSPMAIKDYAEGWQQVKARQGGALTAEQFSVSVRDGKAVLGDLLHRQRRAEMSVADFDQAIASYRGYVQGLGEPAVEEATLERQWGDGRDIFEL